MPAVCRREVCKYAQQSKKRALKLSRLDLAGLHRSQTVGTAHFSKPSSLEYACYRQTVVREEKIFFPPSPRPRALPYPREDFPPLDELSRLDGASVPSPL